MGLSKKLGSSKQEPTEAEYQWSTQCYTLNEIIEKFKLPKVVQCASACKLNLSEFEFDLKQPLLVYRKRQVRKVFARSLKAEADDTHEQTSFGPPVIIPEDYDGWFTVLSSREDRPQRHTRIETVASCPSERFLVVTQLPVLIHTPDIHGRSHYVLGDVMPGDVLRRTGLCDSTSDMSECMPTLKKGRPCLKCTDEKNDELIIPFHHRAKMFEISDDRTPTPQGLVRIRHVIEYGEALFPTVVRLAFGDPPAVVYTFTGELKLEKVFDEESVLASTLNKDSPFPLEMRTDSKVKFCMALNDADIKRTSDYTYASSACDELGDKYLTGMKVSFTLQPEMVPLDPLDWSLSETGSEVESSDVQDVDAQSEFEIDWDPDRTSSMLSLQEKQLDVFGQDMNTGRQRRRIERTPSANKKRHSDQNDFVKVKTDVTNQTIFMEGMTEEMV